MTDYRNLVWLKQKQSLDVIEIKNYVLEKGIQMNNGTELELNFISGVLSDIETIELPWSDYEQASIGVDWDASCGCLKRMPQVLTESESDRLREIKDRIRAQKEKILALDFTYPKID